MKYRDIQKTAISDPEQEKASVSGASQASAEIFSHTSYRSFLRAELSSKITRNPRYSLRAFAQSLGLSPSLLSRVLRGEQNFSEAMACQVAMRRGLEGLAFEYFTALVQYESSTAMTVKSRMQDRLRTIRESAGVTSEKTQQGAVGGFQELSVDVFRCISDWFHLPILEMTHLPPPFQLSAKSAALRLGISAVEAEAAFERLERLELIERDTKGRWKKSVSNPWFRSQTPNAALRAYHRAFLEKAIVAIEEQKPEDRHLGTYNFVLDAKDMSRAQARLDEFAQSFIKEFGRPKTPTGVYALGFQLHQVTRPEDRKRK